ncbi:MAG: ATP-binding protein [Firmicutes bacterium]|nr:ATP-binding protein [Bacillota bacterium]
MFEPFSQENSGARTTCQGTGLGLSIVKKLVDAMGGTVTVVSEKGVGTTFITEIPLKLDPAASDAEKPEEEIDTTVFRGLHVLLVEDNEVNMEIAAFLLEDSGAEVTKAWNGAEGLEKFKASAPGTYDLILMDIMMPVMNGWRRQRRSVRSTARIRRPCRSSP